MGRKKGKRQMLIRFSGVCKDFYVNRYKFDCGDLKRVNPLIGSPQRSPAVNLVSEGRHYGLYSSNERRKLEIGQPKKALGFGAVGMPVGVAYSSNVGMDPGRGGGRTPA